MHESIDNHSTLIRILPQSVVSLTLTDVVGGRVLARVIQGLLRLADATLEGQFPALNTVRCYTEQHLDSCDLVDKFANAGVEFVHSLASAKA